MSGVAIEIKTTCSSCGNQICLNALVPKIRCFYCGKVSEFDADVWKNLLEDAVPEALGFEEKEGRNSTIMTGNGTFQLMYGKLAPRDDATKIPYDMKAVGEAFAAAGESEFLWDFQGRPVSVRSVPDEYKSFLEGAKFLIGEDADLLPSSGDDLTQVVFPKGIAPVAFQCTQCAAGLEVDGTQRKVRCDHCGMTSFLPDDVWQRLHPTKAAIRWFIWVEETERSFMWEDDISAFVVDKNGRMFMCLEDPDDSNKTALVCLTPDLKKEWMVKGINLPFDDSNRFPRLAWTQDRRLLIWSDRKEVLRILSAEDGSEIARIGGKTGQQPADPNQPFSMKDCIALVCDLDGSLLVMHTLASKDDDGWSDNYYELRRYDQQGNRLATWGDEGKGDKKPGIFAKLFGAMKNQAPVYFDEIGDRQILFKDQVKILFGPDQHLYIWEHRRVARFDRKGKKIYSTPEREGNSITDLCVDSKSNVLFIQDDEIVKVSPDGVSIGVLVASREKGGSMGAEDYIAVDEAGAIYVVGYSGRLRKFASDGRLVTAAKKSLEEDREYSEERKSAEEE